MISFNLEDPDSFLWPKDPQGTSVLSGWTPHLSGLSLNRWFSIRSDFGPRGTFDNIRRHCWLSQGGRRVLLASSGQRPGMLLDIGQCAGQSSLQKNCLAQNVNSATGDESWLKFVSSERSSLSIFIESWFPCPSSLTLLTTVCTCVFVLFHTLACSTRLETKYVLFSFVALAPDTQ